LQLGPEVWRVLAKAHAVRNVSEYQGTLEVTERLVADVITAARRVAETIGRLPPIG
jgi:hypothetical protein